MKFRRLHFRRPLTCLAWATALAAQTPAPPPGHPAQVRAVIMTVPPREDVPADIVLRSGHSGRVTALLFSADGSMLGSAGEDKMVVLWDPSTGAELKSFPHAAAVRAIALSPDGRLLASGADDGSIAIWSLGTGKLEKALKGHREPVTKLAFSADGTKLASGGGSQWGDGAGSVRVWDVAAGRELCTVVPSAIGITGLLFAADGRSVFVATAEGDMEIVGQIRQFELETGAIISTRPGILKAASRDGHWLALQHPSRGQGVQIFEAGAEDAAGLLPGQVETAVAFSPRGDWIAYASEADFHVRTTLAGRSLPAITAYGWTQEQLALSPGGALLAALGPGGIAVWDTASGQLVRTMTEFGVGALAFSPDEKALAAGSQGDNGLRVWDLASKRQLQAAAEGESVIGMAFSPDGRFIAAGSRVIRLWEASTLAMLREFHGVSGVVTSPAFSPDGRLLAVNSRGTVFVWDVATGAVLRRFGGYDLYTAGALAFSHDGRQVAVGAAAGAFKVYSVESGEALQSFSTTGQTSALAFSADGSLVAAGSRAAIRVQQGPDGQARLEPVRDQPGSLAAWDLKTGRRLFSITVGDWVSAVAFTGDGKFLLAAFGPMYQPGTVKLFDAATGREVRTLVEKVDAERAAVFSPRLSYLAGGATGGGVKLWRLPELH